MRIDDEFKRVCEEHGGEIEDKGYEIVCKIWDDEEKFIEFSKWMQKNILPKKHELRKIYASDYSFIDTLPNVFARFEISRTSGKLITGAKTYEGQEGILYMLEEQINERKPNIDRDARDALIDDAIREWRNKFPMEKDDTEIDIDWDDDYDTWIIYSTREKEIHDYDYLEGIFDKEIEIAEHALDDIPYPNIK